MELTAMSKMGERDKVFLLFDFVFKKPNEKKCYQNVYMAFKKSKPILEPKMAFNALNNHYHE